LVLLPFVFAACQNPTAADYVPPPPSYEPEPQPPQPLPPAYMVQDLETLYQNIIWIKAGWSFGRVLQWFPLEGIERYVYPMPYNSYLRISSYLREFRTNRTVTTLPTGAITAIAVEQLSITAQSLTVVKHNTIGGARTTRYIVPRYVRL
jgi:hypothetical protein